MAPASGDPSAWRRAAGDRTRYRPTLLDDGVTLPRTTIHQGDRPTAQAPQPPKYTRPQPGSDASPSS
ncbi:hypothetical protein GCM10019016_024980 [Streptomyces prasinosporus]|uniref:Uncharacterized protein n=1 Tax=Streptomyces prasinosporus TaxID=68256 RepID=A0ABP6TKY6_9ACTN|nr:hypothetical protein GCM10010332_28260 [Streptomyces albogriseolus]